MSAGDGLGRAGLLPAILAALALRRSGLVPHREEPEGQGAGGGGGEGRETRDVNVRKTVLVMAGLGLAAMAVVGGMALLMSVFDARQRAALPGLTPQQTTALVPPPPNLQANPYADLDRQRAAARADLDGYGYLDPGHTRARIPIDRAMALAVGRPLGGTGPAR